jgi:hypothetical protein
LILRINVKKKRSAVARKTVWNWPLNMVRSTRGVLSAWKLSLVRFRLTVARLRKPAFSSGARHRAVEGSQ